MNCPRDNIPLIQRRLDENYFHFCERCHGLWFSKAGLKRILAAKNRPVIVKPGEEPWVTHTECDTPGKCPIDGTTPMVLGTHHGVCVDICHEHKGIWLDSSELEKMVEGFRKGIDSGKPLQEFAGHVVEEIFFQGVGELIFEVGAVGLEGAAEVAMEVVPGIAEAVFSVIVEIVSFVFEW